MTGSNIVPRREFGDSAPVLLDFQSPSSAIINAPLPRSAQRVVWVITSLVLAIVAVIALIPVDRVVTARGVVVSQSPTVLVQPLDTAIVRSIEVREGQVVSRGQLLARLDPTFASADVAALEGQQRKLDAEVARLRAEATGAPFSYTGSDPTWSLQAAIYTARKAQYEAKLENYSHRLEELSATIARSRAAASTYSERLGIARGLEDMRKKLESMQAGSRLNTLLAADSRLEVERALSDAERTADVTKREQDALAAERDAFVRGWTAETSQILSETASKANDIREQLNKAALRRDLVELRSDTDSIVQSVAKVSVGSVMQSGQQFMTLVPLGAPLEIEGDISGRENGFVHVHDPVSIKFDTFPYSQYGTAEGSVRIISPDSFNPQNETHQSTETRSMPHTDAFYRTRISIDKVGLHGVPDGFRLIPGMPVSADIKVGQRTVLSYLLGSILPVIYEGMREP